MGVKVHCNGDVICNVSVLNLSDSTGRLLVRVAFRATKSAQVSQEMAPNGTSPCSSASDRSLPPAGGTPSPSPFYSRIQRECTRGSSIEQTALSPRFHVGSALIRLD